jgi:hypothetical protein
MKWSSTIGKIIFCWILGIQVLPAQNLPLGSWQTHLPFTNAVSVAVSKQYVYCGTEFEVFSYGINDGAIRKFTKATGLSDIGIASIAYDSLTSSLVIAYNTSNIDIIQNGKITNIPFVKDANILGDKQIKRVFCRKGNAYIATGFGIVRLNLEKKEIPAAYFFNIGGTNFAVNDVWVNDTYIYAATPNGVFRGRNDGTANLVNFLEWQKFDVGDGIPSQEASAISGEGEEVFTSIGSVVYAYDGNSWSPFYTMPAVGATSLLKTPRRLIITQDGRIIIIPVSGAPVVANETFYIQRPRQIAEDINGELWYADFFRGLVKFVSASEQLPVTPNGPGSITNSQMEYYQGKMWVTSSPINRGWTPTGNLNGYYISDNHFWENRNQFNTPFLEGKQDISVIRVIPNEGTILMGAHFSGLIEYKPSDNTYKFIDNLPNTNVPLRPTGAVLDMFGNVWISNAFSSSPIICRKPGGDYVPFSTTLLSNRLVNGITVDDFGQVWAIAENNGLVVLNYGRTVDDKSDDQYITFTTTPGSGGLPTNSVTSVTTDKKGQIWIGTLQGVVYVPCPGSVFNRQCDAQRICIPRNDGTNFCDLLLENELITTILPDEANRKWIGTTNGLFLQSEDGLESIYYFNEDNSPLLSNVIRNLGINPDNGDLFIGTDKGICSFRAEATKTTKGSKPFAYPNPVRPGYEGPIAVRNLPDNAFVKVTDASGLLVFEEFSTGGQFIWDGRDRNGNKVKTGVYYILATASDNSEKVATKIAIVR